MFKTVIGFLGKPSANGPLNIELPEKLKIDSSILIDGSIYYVHRVTLMIKEGEAVYHVMVSKDERLKELRDLIREVD